MKRVTLDTNVLPADDLLRKAPAEEFDFAVISITKGEAAGTSIAVSLEPLTSVPHLIAYGDRAYGAHAYGGVPDSECCEKVLEIIANGSFPPQNRRENLSPGQCRQFRDALILCTHIRDRRDIFVTNDSRGFIRDGRRELLQHEFETKILTRDEFVADFGLRA
jgi:hypothetical protein